MSTGRMGNLTRRGGYGFSQATVRKYEAELVAPLEAYLQRQHHAHDSKSKGKAAGRSKGSGGGDDNDDVTEGLRALLRSASEAVGVAEAASDTEARLAAREREVAQLKEALARVERLYTGGGGAGSASSATSELDGDGASLRLCQSPSCDPSQWINFAQHRWVRSPRCAGST